MTQIRSAEYLVEAADRVMIKDLAARYACYIDYWQPGLPTVDSLFVEDGRYLIPSLGIEAEGRAAIREMAKLITSADRHMHHVQTNHIIDIAGQSASGRCHFNEFVTGSKGIIGYSQGWYEDDYVWEGERWWFKVRRTHITRQVADLMISPEMIAQGFTLLDKMIVKSSR